MTSLLNSEPDATPKWEGNEKDETASCVVHIQSQMENALTAFQEQFIDVLNEGGQDWMSL